MVIAGALWYAAVRLTAQFLQASGKECTTDCDTAGNLMAEEVVHAPARMTSRVTESASSERQAVFYLRHDTRPGEGGLVGMRNTPADLQALSRSSGTGIVQL